MLVKYAGSYPRNMELESLCMRSCDLRLNKLLRCILYHTYEEITLSWHLNNEKEAHHAKTYSKEVETSAVQ